MSGRTIFRMLMTMTLVLAFACPAFAVGHQGITDCFVCHDFEVGVYGCTTDSCHAFSQGYQPDDHDPPINLRWVKNSFAYPSVIRENVRFTAFSWDEAWGPTPDGTMADGVDSKLDGPCEVCHTQTIYHTNTGDDKAHFDGQDCLVCHPHFPLEADYFTAELVGPQSHDTHLNDDKGPKLSDCTDCHDEANFSYFADGQPLAQTNVCDPCHSPDGAFEGVDDEQIGAKPNWENGVYKANGIELKAAKGDWCATCHDDGTSVVYGAVAPNVMGDDTTYSYNTSGHGRPDIEAKCGDCHTLSSIHTDGQQRTYQADLDNYTVGYRLLFSMDVPRIGNSGPEAFTLCFECHVYDNIVGTSSNFRDDEKSLQYHELHLHELFEFLDVWDSDWNGEVDSAMSCTACHNVHGSPMEIGASLGPNPVMIRHGELISTPGTDDKVPAMDFRWYEIDESTITPNLNDSWYGGLWCGAWSALEVNNVCYGCHSTGLITYYRSVGGPPPDEVVVSVERVWTTDLSDIDKTTFQPEEDIRYHVRFNIAGPAGNHYVKAHGKAFNMTDTEWTTKLRNNNTLLVPGTYEWTWDEIVPAEAAPGSEAKVKLTIKVYDTVDDSGSVVSQETKSKKFNILSSTRISVEDVWTTDLSDVEKTSFERNEDIRYHVRFTVVGPGSHYVKANGKAFNLDGSDWSTKFNNDGTLFSDTYEWTWDKKVPTEASSGSQAKVRITLKMFDQPGGTELGSDRGTQEFSVEGDGTWVVVEDVWTTDLSDVEKTVFNPEEDIRYHVRFTVTGAGSYYVKANAKAFNVTGDEWSKGYKKDDDAATADTYEWSWDKQVPAEASPQSEAKVKITVKMYDMPDGTELSRDKKSTGFDIGGGL